MFLLAKLKHCLPQVLWRYSGKRPTTLGANTRLYDWIPQNDLLGKTQEKAVQVDDEWISEVTI